jgi:hypothetical protein
MWAGAFVGVSREGKWKIRPSRRRAAAPDRAAPLVPGHNCWRIEQADQVRLIVDAADYFALVRRR